MFWKIIFFIMVIVIVQYISSLAFSFDLPADSSRFPELSEEVLLYGARFMAVFFIYYLSVVTLAIYELAFYKSVVSPTFLKINFWALILPISIIMVSLGIIRIVFLIIKPSDMAVTVEDWLVSILGTIMYLITAIGSYNSAYTKITDTENA